MAVSAICPGSFDPITMGHLDIVERAASRFQTIIVAVMENPRKDPLFTVDERMSLIEETTGHLENIEIEKFSGLLVDFCREVDVYTVCKGLRAVSDFEYELQMAQMNQRMGQVETLFMSTSPDYSYLSSSLVKEVARYGGPLDGVVPIPVAKALQEAYADREVASGS